jgi:hypothetical protein
MPFAQTLRNCQKIMLAISGVWLCLFSGNFSILTQMPIPGHPPSQVPGNESDAEWQSLTGSVILLSDLK